MVAGAACMARINSLLKVLVVGPAILAAIVPAGLARADGIVGSISSVKGAVAIVRRGKTLTAANGMTIKFHDQVITGADGSVTIVMPDHSSLHLGQSGKLSIGQSKRLNESTAPSK